MQLEIGDIFEIITGKGKAYIQYVKAPRNNNELEKIKVFYTLHDNRPSELNTITNST